MNILIINHYAGSIKHGMEYRPYYMAKEFVNLGHKVSIIASSYSHLRDEIIDVKTENFNGITYYWEKNIKYNSNGIKRVFNMIFFSVKIFLKSKYYSKLLKPDLVIASSPHPFIIYGARRISVLSKSKLFFEVRDLWPLTLMKLGNYSKFNPFILIMQITEIYAYRYSDKVISLLPGAKDYMISKGLSGEKFLYIPNGVDVSEWDNIEKLDQEIEKVLLEQKNNNKFMVGYVGGHSISNVLDTIIEAIELINDSSVVLTLVGDGIEKERLKIKVKNLGIKNIIFLNNIKKQQVPKLLSYFDVLYIGADKNPLYQYGVSPNKLMDYMMAATPVVQSMDAYNDMVKDSACGFSVESENSRAVADAILKIKKTSKEDRLKMGSNGKEYIVKYHAYKKLVAELIKVVINEKKDSK